MSVDSGRSFSALEPLALDASPSEEAQAAATSERFSRTSPDLLQSFPFHPLFAFQMYGAAMASLSMLAPPLSSPPFFSSPFPFLKSWYAQFDAGGLEKLIDTIGEGNDPEAQRPEFQQAVYKEALRRLFSYLQGLQCYDAYRSQVRPQDAPTLAQIGSACLRDYGSLYEAPSTAQPVLFVPSLINRGSIFDLIPRESFFAYLARRGFRPLLVDWGEPGEEEQNFSLADYAEQRLQPFVDISLDLAKGTLPMAGYCMGGLLALAETLNRKEISGLALLAVPWDFQVDRTPLASPFLAFWIQAMLASLSHTPVLRPEFLQAYFYFLDPVRCIRKFQELNNQRTSASKVHQFTALENWVQDSVPLAGKVAREVFEQWFLKNTLARHHRLSGKKLDFSSFSKPILAVIPENDHIVPTKSAESLVEQFCSAPTQVLRPPLGHVGMVVSRAAKSEVWEPFVDWLSGL